MTTVLSLDGVSRTYESPAGPVRALTEVNFDVFTGELVAIIGPSGSGKSTLLNILGLLDRPTKGRYLINSRDTADLHEAERTHIRARRIGFVFQAFHLIEHKTALSNVVLPLMYGRMPRKKRSVAAAAALARVGLQHRLHSYPRTLSGGEKQRVSIARATVHGPDMLLCDEPTGNLDTDTSARVMDLLKGLTEEGLAVVVVTHDLMVTKSADRVLRVRDGRLTETTTVALSDDG